MKELITLVRPARLSSHSDLSKRADAPSGSCLSVRARLYDGKVLLVQWEGREWYTANPDWVPPQKAEREEEKQKLPWDAPWRGRRKKA